MPERLTPEQLEKFADELQVAYPDRAVIRGLRQAARDARTLARVQAWTEEVRPKRGTPDPRVSESTFRTVEDIVDVAIVETKLKVAALLRAEEG